MRRVGDDGYAQGVEVAEVFARVGFWAEGEAFELFDLGDFETWILVYC